MNAPMPTNPLLPAQGLPAFDAILAEHVTPALDLLLAEAEAALQAAVGPAVPADYDALSRVLDVSVERLSHAWGLVNHLNHVADTPELRTAYNQNLPRVTEFTTRLGADERLYAKYKAVSKQAGSLGPARRRALDNALRDFVLSGAELQGQAKARFVALQERLAQCGQTYGEHVQDATDRFALFVAPERLAGVPQDVIDATRAAAQAEGRDGCKLTLQAPCYMPVMMHARDRALRQELHRAYFTRASELGPAELDNTALMTELVQLRQEEAALLGLGSYAELSLVPKMADTPQQVTDFLRDLARRARPHAERDFAELRDFARRELGLPDLQAWDIAFASERLLESRYAFSEQEVKLYFPLPRVLQGLFGIVETLFGVAIRPDHAPVWHDSVGLHRIERSTPQGPQLVGQFYLDLQARSGKRPGAWVDVVRSRWARPDADGAVQTPIAHLVCNFAPPVGDKPALLTHDDVVTLFHEFGHGLHHMLTQVDERAVSGFYGVEWDAVELPSQFMENFCWEWEVLSRLTAQVDTGEPLPRALFDKMVAARNFQSGLATLRQVEFALFDMRLHHEADAATRIGQVMSEVQAEVAVLPAPDYNRMAHTFAHIFAGGYSAGYYSYKWAEVMSADAYSAFEESGVLDRATGQRYLNEILGVGGSRPALESFKAFRGREPSIEALLRHQGMA
jgi:oligopeptidase A